MDSPLGVNFVDQFFLWLLHLELFLRRLNYELSFIPIALLDDLAVFVVQLALAMLIVIFKLALVLMTICLGPNTVAISIVIFELSFIHYSK